MKVLKEREEMECVVSAHKALIVATAERDTGGRVTGAYYLLRNTIVIPSAALGGALWDFVSPEIAFTSPRQSA